MQNFQMKLQHRQLTPETETTFLDTNVHKGERFQKKTNQYLMCACISKPLKHFSLHIFPHAPPPWGVKRGFIKGEALRPSRTNSSKTLFEDIIKNFGKHLQKERLPRKSYTKYTFRSEF